MKKYFLLTFLLITSLGFSQITISGKVTDESGEPLPGTSITEKGTTKGVVSDFNGNYDISISSNEAILTVSFIGFETQEINVSGQNRIDIELLNPLYP